MNLGIPPEREFPVPTGVPSAVTLHELALLQRFAHEAGTVLEIGTHYGFSCIGMALAGAHVTSVDPHFEGPADAPDTWAPFQANLARHVPASAMLAAGAGIGSVWPIKIAVEDWHEDEREDRHFSEFGMVFIDGNHTWPCPWRDTEIAFLHLVAPGYIAFHDVTPNWPGVYRAALQLEAKGWREVGRVQTLRVYQRPLRLRRRRAFVVDHAGLAPGATGPAG